MFLAAARRALRVPTPAIAKRRAPSPSLSEVSEDPSSEAGPDIDVPDAPQEARLVLPGDEEFSIAEDLQYWVDLATVASTPNKQEPTRIDEYDWNRKVSSVLDRTSAPALATRRNLQLEDIGGAREVRLAIQPLSAMQASFLQRIRQHTIRSMLQTQRRIFTAQLAQNMQEHREYIQNLRGELRTTIERWARDHTEPTAQQAGRSAAAAASRRFLKSKVHSSLPPPARAPEFTSAMISDDVVTQSIRRAHVAAARQAAAIMGADVAGGLALVQRVDGNAKQVEQRGSEQLWDEAFRSSGLSLVAGSTRPS